jgi:hypothetical protein
MVTAEERIKILQMLQDGKISSEAAAQLLQAMGDGEPAAPPPQTKPERAAPAVAIEPGSKPRWLRVRVTDTDTGRPRVNVRLPISLVDLGLKIGARYTPEIEGLNVQELIEAAQTGDSGAFVDVYDEEDGEHVEVFLE